MSAPALPGLLVDERTGTVSLGGELVELRRRLDLTLGTLADRWSPVDEEHSPLLPQEDLVRSGWLTGFPHLALLVSGSDAPGGSGPSSTPVSPSPVLAPAACHAVYPARSGTDLSAPLHIRVSGHAFRNEASFSPLRRQRSFTMREVVCVGTPSEVDAFLEESLSDVDALLRRLGIETSWERATDPFYRPDAPEALVQRLVPLKREAVLAGDDLALASLNVHADHFTRAFAITRSGTVAASGCVAFGVERWMWAWCAAHGPDVRSWPRLLGRSW